MLSSGDGVLDGRHHSFWRARTASMRIYTNEATEVPRPFVSLKVTVWARLALDYTNKPTEASKPSGIAERMLRGRLHERSHRMLEFQGLFFAVRKRTHSGGAVRAGSHQYRKCENKPTSSNARSGPERPREGPQTPRPRILKPRKQTHSKHPLDDENYQTKPNKRWESMGL